MCAWTVRQVGAVGSLKVGEQMGRWVGEWRGSDWVSGVSAMGAVWMLLRESGSSIAGMSRGGSPRQSVFRCDWAQARFMSGFTGGLCGIQAGPLRSSPDFPPDLP
ncbi:uncharacterized protein CANTADRAFT_116476 [Suhomyces tanzawaensis NRRL Y-17324]|uniref:Uncharacterized protein n=1 Tax=Suhomyces tanzawaensis NRRL Y-17324 TaxID=984487 RepID=A0A1E4SQ85_9ASCO|nr:uncharacterized protein CANTADRAFT_116476 [Suhomyces tanzawaensis NRRL Y-17324]ODV81666.1 hypothetical protein CANTADRAFT_116476 [Suhomyces tanzawaensis NRRL Y-17324]